MKWHYRVIDSYGGLEMEETLNAYEEQGWTIVRIDYEEKALYEPYHIIAKIKERKLKL